MYLPNPEPAALERDRSCASMIMHLAALAFRLQPQDVARSRRTASSAVKGRHAAMYLMHVALNVPLSRVANAFDRDRTTISHACTRIEALRDDREFDRRLTVLEDCLAGLPTLMNEGAA